MECVRCDRVNKKEQNKKQQNQLIPGKVVETTKKTHTHEKKKYVEFISGYNESTEEVKKRQQQENKKKVVRREETKIKIINPKAAGENVFPFPQCACVYVISFV